MKTLYSGFLIALLLASCTARLPKDFVSENKPADIYPDYSGITLPCNIAPLNFDIKDTADEFMTRISGQSGEEIILVGPKIRMDQTDWKNLIEKNKGKTYSVEIFLKKNGKWFKRPTITNFIAADSIDPYISYRLIEPGYMSYGTISINQRNLTNFDEREIYNNTKTATPGEGKLQCVNCHAYQNYRTENMQLHFRLYKGGTVIVCDGKASKVDTKADGALSACVYPAWHPTEKLIAYSVNTTGQIFHTTNTEKVEVIDSKSDLVLYDIKKNEIRYISNDKESLETWPTWSPDGKTLYFASARFLQKTDDPMEDVVRDYHSVRYNLLKMSFDPQTRKFGPQDTVFSASRIGKSASLSRISPDGRYLLFTLADYGNFHIWHKSTDLYLMDLKTGGVRNLKEVNSSDVDSYHSWSSNGRWIIFSSRRDDGSYTRFYITYFDRSGRARKPFILPQKNPELYARLLKSFNVPEFMVEPVRLSTQDFYKVISSDPVKARYVK